MILPDSTGVISRLCTRRSDGGVLSFDELYVRLRPKRSLCGHGSTSRPEA